MKYEPTLLKSTKEYSYVLQKLTEDEYLELDSNIKNEEYIKDNFGIIDTDIITYGDTSEISDKILGKIISQVTTEHKIFNINVNRSSIELRKHYECFVVKDYHKRYVPIHEDLKSSWNCILAKYHNPKYVLIYKLNIIKLKFDEFIKTYQDVEK